MVLLLLGRRNENLIQTQSSLLPSYELLYFPLIKHHPFKILVRVSLGNEALIYSEVFMTCLLLYSWIFYSIVLALNEKDF